jgi:hypothetical protein
MSAADVEESSFPPIDDCCKTLAQTGTKTSAAEVFVIDVMNARTTGKAPAPWRRAGQTGVGGAYAGHLHCLGIVSSGENLIAFSKSE